MRILILTQYFPPEAGAAQTRLGMMTREFIKLGHEVDVVTAMPNYPLGEIFPAYRGKAYALEKSEPGLRVYRYWLWASSGRGLGRLFSYLSFMVMSFLAPFQLRRPDLVFVNSGPLFLGLPGVFFSWLYRVPLVLQVADLWPRSVEHLQGLGSRFLLRLARQFEAWVYRHSDVVNAITEGVRDNLLQEKKLSERKVLFYPNGVDLELFQSSRASPRANELRRQLNLEDQLVLIYPGNHGHAHALDSVLRAAELLQTQNEEAAGLLENAVAPEKIHFLLVGGGSEKASLVAMAQRLGLRNLTFHDPVPFEELPPYIELADLGLIHLKASDLALETRPAKMFPLLSMAKPILYCGEGEGADLIRRADCGVVVPSEDPKALIQGIGKLVRRFAEDSQIGLKGRKLVENSFSFSALTEKWWRDYREIHR